jgi:D-alanyl-D-alanine carboxypeptidase (penicillin-binding protein 5/6)
MYPASLTKMMTGLLTVERVDLDQEVVVAEEAAQVGETTLYLEAGQSLTARELLAAAMLKSANDAAAALACHLEGSQAGFAEAMNRRARELGMADTQFRNPHGLHDPEHYTTAEDLAKLARAVMSHPQLRELVGQTEATLPHLPPERQVVTNQNRLVHRWDPCTGIKMGYTRQAGNCIAAAARSGDQELLAIVLHSDDVVNDAHALLEWGLESFMLVRPAELLGQSWQVMVRGGQQPYARVQVPSTAGLVLPKDQKNWQVEVVDLAAQAAPLEMGEEVGYALVRVAGEPRLRVPLVAAEQVAVASPPRARLAALGIILLMGMTVLAYGAARKAARARRTRIAAGLRADRDLRSSHRERGNGHRPGDPGGPGRGRPARGRAARGVVAPEEIRGDEQARRSVDR